MQSNDSSDEELFAALENASNVQGLAGRLSFPSERRQEKSPSSLWSSSDDEDYAEVGPGSGGDTLDARWVGHTPGTRLPRPKKVGSFVIGAKIGEGAHATVREGVNTDSLRVVAVKVVEMRRLRKVKGGVENIKREIRVQKALKRHPNLVELFHVLEDETKGKTYLFMEMCTGCSLQQLQDLAPEKRFPPSQVAHFLFQAMTGVLYMHLHGYVHRDLKPGNMLLNADGHLKIADFGVAERLDQYTAEDSVTRTSGSPAFQAPEIAKGDDEYSGTKVDVWALGVTAYYLLTGRIPFDAENLVDLFNIISIGEYEEPVEVDSSVRTLLAHMLEVDWHTRWGVEEVLKHPWIARAEQVPSAEKRAEHGWVEIPRRRFSILDLAQQFVDGHPTEAIPVEKDKATIVPSATPVGSSSQYGLFTPHAELEVAGAGTESIRGGRVEDSCGPQPSSPSDEERAVDPLEAALAAGAFRGGTSFLGARTGLHGQEDETTRERHTGKADLPNQGADNPDTCESLAHGLRDSAGMHGVGSGSTDAGSASQASDTFSQVPGPDQSHSSSPAVGRSRAACGEKVHEPPGRASRVDTENTRTNSEKGCVML